MTTIPEAGPVNSTWRGGFALSRKHAPIILIFRYNALSVTIVAHSLFRFDESDCPNIVEDAAVALSRLAKHKNVLAAHFLSLPLALN